MISINKMFKGAALINLSTNYLFEVFPIRRENCKKLYHISMVLIAVKEYSEGPFLSDKLRFGLRSFLNDTTVLIQHTLNFTPANVHKADLTKNKTIHG